jgi:hypothetical protein
VLVGPGGEGKAALALHVFNDPVVNRPVVLKLQGAEGVGDALYEVLQGVGVVVEGVDHPPVPHVVMGGVDDAVEDRVPQLEVGVGGVNLGPEDPASRGELSPGHPLEEV